MSVLYLLLCSAPTTPDGLSAWRTSSPVRASPSRRENQGLWLVAHHFGSFLMNVAHIEWTSCVSLWKITLQHYSSCGVNAALLSIVMHLHVLVHVGSERQMCLFFFQDAVIQKRTETFWPQLLLFLILPASSPVLFPRNPPLAPLCLQRR